MFKRSLLTLLAVLFLSPVFSTVVAYGETGSGSSPTTTPKPSTTNTTTSSSPNQTGSSNTQTQETDAQKAERSTRIEKLKEQLKIKLATADKDKLEAKCQAAQGKVSGVSESVKGAETSRSEVHKNLLNRLKDLEAKLKAKNVDTTQLDADITVLSTKIDTFNADLATYKQAVTDVQALDCKTDPEGFKAALQTARTDLEKVRSDADAVHAYLNDTIKPLLNTLRSTVSGSTKQNSPTNGQGGTQ